MFTRRFCYMDLIVLAIYIEWFEDPPIWMMIPVFILFILISIVKDAEEYERNDREGRS